MADFRKTDRAKTPVPPSNSPASRTCPSMPLTEAQRLAFLKGREKRMANIEKKKLEKAEMEALNTEVFAESKTPSPPPEKPKLTRKPRKTKASKEPVDVKIDIDLGTSVAPPTPTPEEAIKTEEPEPPLQPAVSSSSAPVFDEDAIANKVVDMLLKKGIGLPAEHHQEKVKIKTKKPRVVKPKSTEFQAPPPPPTSTFTWL